MTARGNRRCTIFTDEVDARFFLRILERTVARSEWKLFAYCLMPNHFHLLLQTPRPTLSDGMQRLNGTYARYFNDVNGFHGPLFQGRFGSRTVEGDEDLLEVARYVLLNPVRAALVSTPEVWRWSSYAATIAATKSPPFLAATEFLAHFGPNWEAARARFSRSVSEGIAG